MAHRAAPPVTTVAVLRALPGLGDMLCLVPALRAIRARHPRAKVTLLGLPSAGWFVERYPHLVDELLPVEGVPGLPEVTPDAGAALGFLRRAQRRHFDLALQLHGSGVTTNPLLTLVGARHQVTARRPGHWVPPGVSIPYPEAGPEVHRLLAVTAAAGCPSVGDGAELPVAGAERTAAAALLRSPGARHRNLVCLHPGASRWDNRWPVERFAAVGDALARRGWGVVLTGTAREGDVTAAVADAMDAPAVDLAGRTSIGTFAAVVAEARLVVTNDTGASHVAAAVGTPSVIVFPADGDPDRWSPLDGARHRRAHGPAPGTGDDRWPSVATVMACVDAAPESQAAAG